MAVELAVAAAASESAEPPAPAEPTCERCGVTLDWRDVLYGRPARAAVEATADSPGAPATGPACKRCHARETRNARSGALRPATRTVTDRKGKQQVSLVTTQRSERRKTAKVDAAAAREKRQAVKPAKVAATETAKPVKPGRAPQRPGGGFADHVVGRWGLSVVVARVQRQRRRMGA